MPIFGCYSYCFKMKITIIGAGNMGGALARGWARSGKHSITVTARSEESLSRFAEIANLHTSKDNLSAVSGADVIVLAVKPWLIESVCGEIARGVDFDHQIILSVAANVFTDSLKACLGRDDAKLFYVMPNIAAEFGEAMTYLAPSSAVSSEETTLVESLLLELGKVKVCKEKEVEAGNMLSGCGIAYVMRFIQAMMEGGVEMGLYPKEAQEIAMQTMKGAVAVLEGRNMHPAVGIDKVTTPGGLTIRGLNELEHAGFNSAVIRCLKAGITKG